jgi:dimethylhistidine N-methyltransferase
MKHANMENLPAIERVKILELEPARDNFGTDVRHGLSSTPKVLSPKYFYDDLGAILFEAICRLPEYYVTRAENRTLELHGSEILRAAGSQLRLVELGSGSATKTRHLIRPLLARQETAEYVSIDIDSGTLAATANALTAQFSGLHVTGLVASFESGVVQIANLARRSGESTLVLFLGSTIGNFEPDARRDLLRMVRSGLREDDALLLGADSAKSEAILIPAYDDALGVTAAFNRNLLVRINRELGGNFDLAHFRHEARYDRELHRIEMHLVSACAHVVHAAGMDVAFAEGETIHTESSYKFTRSEIETLAADTGFELAHAWTDENEWFGDYLLKAT